MDNSETVDNGRGVAVPRVSGGIPPEMSGIVTSHPRDSKLMCPHTISESGSHMLGILFSLFSDAFNIFSNGQSLGFW